MPDEPKKPEGCWNCKGTTFVAAMRTQAIVEIVDGKCVTGDIDPSIVPLVMGLECQKCGTEFGAFRAGSGFRMENFL